MVNPGVVSGVSLVGSAARLLESPGGARRPDSARRPRECGWAWHEASPPPLIFLYNHIGRYFLEGCDLCYAWFP